MFQGAYDCNLRPHNVWKETYSDIVRCPLSVGQGAWEYARLLEIVARYRPTRILEIGTDLGGTFWHWAKLAGEGALAVSLDLRNTSEKAMLWQSMMPTRIIVLALDSHLPETVAEVEALFPEGLDFLFIDGNHQYEAVRSDFMNYGKMVRPGGLIALHDILPNSRDTSIQVCRLWAEIREAGYCTREIMSRRTQDRFGIGLIYVEGV